MPNFVLCLVEFHPPASVYCSRKFCSQLFLLTHDAREFRQLTKLTNPQRFLSVLFALFPSLDYTLAAHKFVSETPKGRERKREKRKKPREKKMANIKSEKFFISPGRFEVKLERCNVQRL